MSVSLHRSSRDRHRAHVAIVQCVGRRIRLARERKGMDAESLAARLGVPAHRLIEHERGRSHIAASTLFDLAKHLDVPIEYFFDGLPQSLAPAPPTPAQFMARRSGAGGDIFALIDAYYAIPDPRQRRAVLTLIRHIGERLL